MSFEYKSELKELLIDYMELLETQDKTEKRGDGYWVCPFCNSGDKCNYTAAFHIKGTTFNCFSCGEHGDIFDLVGYIENLQNDFKKQYNRTLKIMRPYMNSGKTIEVKKESDKILDVIKEEDYTDYLHKCHEGVSQTDYFNKRGLDKGIIDRFNLGYDVKKNLITIPYNPDYKGYVHRILWDSDNKYCKFGNEIFNLNALYMDSANALFLGSKDFVFVTEGQIDAMSFEEIGLNAIGLGGVNEISKLIKQLKKQSCNKILILALDNDKAGRRATGKFIEELAEAELEQEYVVNSNLYGKYKDANEYLVDDRKGFIKKMNEIMGV